MGILDHDPILELREAAIAARIADSRDALFVGIPAELVASLRSSGPPGERLLQDLTELNECDLADGSTPLATWLRNAVALAGVRKEAALFKGLDGGKLAVPAPVAQAGPGPGPTYNIHIHDSNIGERTVRARALIDGEIAASVERPMSELQRF